MVVYAATKHNVAAQEKCVLHYGSYGNLEPRTVMDNMADSTSATTTSSTAPCPGRELERSSGPGVRTLLCCTLRGASVPMMRNGLRRRGSSLILNSLRSRKTLNSFQRN